MPCAVEIKTQPPNEKFVGCIQEQETINLEADVTPAGSPWTYSWSIVTGLGNGTFFPDPTVQNPEFQGGTKGELTIKVDVSDGTESCSKTKELVVIEISDLSESVPLQYMPQVYLEGVQGDYTIPYQHISGAELRAVRIAPPSDPSSPYSWGTDFNAQVNHITGDVQLTFLRDGAYLVKNIRILNGVETEELVEFMFKTSVGSIGHNQTGKTVPVDKPMADLILISSSDCDLLYLKHARLAYDNDEAIDTVADVIAKLPLNL